jgi:pilus assembly protein Flp/PilA
MMKRFLQDQRGATAIEYAIIGAMISIAIIASVSLLGDALDDSFSTTAAKVAATVP